MTKTLITFLLDRSSSMGIILDGTLEAFNGYVDGLRKDQNEEGAQPVALTLLQFDSHHGTQIEKTCFEAEPKDVPVLTRENFRPRGGTPLVDSAIETILALDRSLAVKKEAGQDVKVIVCIQTDGEENASKRTFEELKGLIEARTKDGWQFNFMGAGINAYDQGARMGMSRGSTVSYSNDRESTRNAFAASATNAALYSRGLAATTMYSSSQKLASGDAFDGDHAWVAAPKKGFRTLAGVAMPTGYTKPVGPAVDLTSPAGAEEVKGEPSLTL